MQLETIENQINEANEAYRNGESIITDQQYDSLLEELELLDPDNKLLDKVGGGHIDESRKSKLPIPMFSMNKVKTIEELEKWFKSKGITRETQLVMTPKYDGASLCVDERSKKAWTRGDGIEGQKSDEHLVMMNTNNIDDDIITFGEAIIKRDVFIDKYSEEFSNARNLAGGKLNDKTPKEILNDVDYIRYGLVGRDFLYKSDLLDHLNEQQQHKVPYKITSLDELTEENLKELFLEWSEVYEIDGIIIEVNSEPFREELGREKNGNPCYARAYKGDFTEVKETKINNITWEISKQGLIKPVMNVDSINLEGVNVTNVTGNNAKFMKVNDLGVGSVIKVTRSGGVIPKLVGIVSTTGFELPDVGVEIGWNETEVELITLEETEDQKLKQLISFFEIMEVDNMGEGIVKQFFDNGFNTVEKILSMTKDDMLELEKFGDKKADKLLQSIEDKKTIPLSKVQHGSGMFKNLGSKKLLLLEDLNEKASVETIIEREGFSEISAKSYLDGIVKYNEWVKPLESLLNIVKTEKKEATGSGLEGKVFVFTGLRLKELQEKIIDMGGTIGSGVSKKTTHLVCKDPNSGSSKLVKAEKLGAKIIGVEELEELLN